jgi:hypothetical protein
MCFSPTASFVTAAITAAVGVVSLTRVNEPRELPLAATPLIFALQQTVEGLLWLDLPAAPQGPIAMSLAILFLFFAEMLWPVYASIAVFLIEPSERRRRLMLLCLAIGIAVSGDLLWRLVARPHGAVILDGHVVYVSEYSLAAGLALAYHMATGLPLMLSSHRTVVALGTIILLGSVMAYAFYEEAFVSVWCFFAAGASVVILYHFEQSRRQRVRIAGALP